MIRRRPDLLAIVVALIGTLAVAAAFLGDLLLSRESEIAAGEQRVQEFGIMLGEHTARSFEAVDILLREIATDLSEIHHDWQGWDSRRGHEYLAKRHARSLPQLRDLVLFDRQGLQRFISTYFPTPRINVRDRPYFVTLEQGQAATTFGPYDRPLFRALHLRTGKAHRGRPAQFRRHRFCRHRACLLPAFLLGESAGGRLRVGDHQCQGTGHRLVPADRSRQAVPRRRHAGGGHAPRGRLRGWLPADGVARGNGLITSLSPVPGFTDLRVLTMIPADTLLAGWRLRFLQLGTLFLLVSGMLVAAACWFVDRVADLRAMADELAASRDQLEERVHAATSRFPGRRTRPKRANKAKSRFLAAASHDLRQPLHALSLFAADLRHRLRSGRPRRPAARG